MNMAHVEDLLYYESKSTFDEDINNGEILNTSIAFIASEGTIYNRGHYFGKQTPPDANFSETSENSLLNKTVTGAINLINETLTGILDSISDINDNILELDAKKAESDNVYSKTEVDNLITEINLFTDAPSDGKSYVRCNNAWVQEKEYLHPTGPGYNHIPAGGNEGDILIWSANGQADWGAPITYNLATTESNGLMSSEDKNKLNNLDNTVSNLSTTVNNLGTSITNINSTITNLLGDLNNIVSFPEAPNDGDRYIRKSLTWEKLNNASSSVNGLMSAEDKQHLDTLYNLIDADNPSDGIINKYNEIVDFLDGIDPEGNTLQDIINTIPTENATTTSDGLMSKEDKTILDNLNTTVNNLDTTVNNIVSFPEAPNDGNKYVRLNKNWVQETSYSNVTISENGLMLATDKAWLENFKNYNSGCNSNANITAISNTKKLSVCSASADSTLGLSAGIPTGYANELHILIHNTGNSAITITIPSTLASVQTINMMGENLEISADKWGEINILTDGSTYYVRHEAI